MKNSKSKWSELVNAEKVTVKLIWTHYANHVLKGIPVKSVQYKETKQAFYAGFFESFSLLFEMTDKVNDDDASEIMDKLYMECFQYLKKIMEKIEKDETN